MGLYAEFGSPLPLVCAITIGGVGAGLILGSASINQLLATGGLPFFLQNFVIALHYSLPPVAPETSPGQLLPMSSLNRCPFNHLLWNAASFPLSASI